MANIFGHLAQRAKLERLLNSSRLPNVLLFSGPSGVGKFLVAKEFARSLICAGFKTRTAEQPAQYGGCAGCDSCRLFEFGNYPDFFLLDCASDEHAGVESVRAVIQSMQYKAFAGSARVVVFKDLENLSLTALNVLLKSLEEPRPDTYFIITSANHYKLPGTLLSRCQLWYFDQLGEAEIRQYIRANYPEADSATLAVLADGSLENLDSLISDVQGLHELESVVDELCRQRFESAYKFINEVARDKALLRTRLATLRIIARRRMHLETDALLQGRYALLLQNLIELERLIFERNLSASHALSLVLVDFGLGPNLRFASELGRGASLAEKVTL